MGSRETYGAKLVCPSCGATGSVKLSEAENPVFDPNPRRELEEAAEGFEWESGGTWAQSATFRCKTCGASVPAS